MPYTYKLYQSMVMLQSQRVNIGQIKAEPFVRNIGFYFTRPFLVILHRLLRLTAGTKKIGNFSQGNCVIQ